MIVLAIAATFGAGAWTLAFFLPNMSLSLSKLTAGERLSVLAGWGIAAIFWLAWWVG